jgi:alpha-tubulin suppressor-like RCC1 family protein
VAISGRSAQQAPHDPLPGDINTGAQVTDMAAGDFHTCALSSDGRLACWGLGTSGQLGYANFNNQGAPLRPASTWT